MFEEADGDVAVAKGHPFEEKAAGSVDSAEV